MPGMTPEERRIRNALAAQPTVTDTSQATPTQIMSQRNDLQREINQTIKLTVDDNSVVLRDGTIPFEAPQKGKEPTLSTHLATKSYVDSTDAGKLTSVIDAAATPGTGGQHGNLPSGHVCLIEDGGASQDEATLYNVASGNANLVIEDDEDNSGNAFIKFTAQDQSVSLHRFDTVYTYNSGDENKDTAAASGADGIAFVDTANTTWTAVAPAGSGAYTNKAKVSLVTANDNTTYTTNASTVSGGANFNLLASNPTSTDVLKFAGGGTTTVSRTDASTITITSTDANDNYYLTGVTKSSNTLTFAVSGASDPTYTFGSNAFNSTAYLTAISSTLATDESASPPRVSILDDSSTVKALEEGSGISIEESSTAGGDTVKISSTVDTSGLLTNGIVIIEDWNGSEVEETASASGGDKLRFVENDGIEWSISGPSSNVISVTPSLSGYNSTNWNNAYTHSQATHAPTAAITASSSDTLTNKGGNISQWTNNSNYLTGNQTVTLSGDVTGSGTTAITCVVVDDSHNHVQSNIDGLSTSLAAKADLAGPTFTADINVADSIWINGYTDNTASRIRFHHDTNHAYQDWETGNYYIRYDTTTKYMMDSSGNVHADADVYAYSTSVGSDIKLKKNITDTKYGLSDVLKLRGVDFDWKEKRDGRHDIGVIAQEVKEVIPEVVREVDDFEGGTYLTVDYSKLVPVLIEAIKELSERKCNCGV